MKRVLLIVCLLILALPASAQLLTKEEINSKLGSKTSYSKQEVVDLVYNIITAYDAADIALEKRLVSENEARFEEWKAAYKAGLATLKEKNKLLGTENAVHWVVDGLIGAGMIVYGILQADPVMIGTGGIMTGASAFRLIIYL